MQGRARRKSDQGVCWLSGNSHCVLWCGWSRFRGNQPFSPWFQFPHVLQPLLLCDSLETFWHRPPASCQRAEWCEPKDKKKKEIPRKVSTKASTWQHSGCFWTAWQMPAFSLFTTSHHTAWCSMRTIWNLYLEMSSFCLNSPSCIWLLGAGPSLQLPPTAAPWTSPCRRKLQCSGPVLEI